MRILHIITALERGGAEAMLEKVVAAGGRHHHMVVSLRDEGPIGRQIALRGIKVSALRLGSALGTPLALPRLIGLVRKHRPDVIQGWMDHGNLAATLAHRFARAGTHLAWNVRRSLDSADWDRGFSRRLVGINAKLSDRPDCIIYNSTAGAVQHEGIGYSQERRQIIPNGFDLARFTPSSPIRAAQRREFRVAEDELLIGLVARFHPCKNHRAFFEAAARLLSKGVRARFLFAGAGMILENPDVSGPLRDLDILDHVILLGDRSDMPAVTASLDIACNVSHGEGFPNAIGEAMACSVPCLVADVGDCRLIVGDTGVVCDSNDAAGIEQGLMRLVEAGPDRRTELGRCARARIDAHFSITAVTARYDTLYESLTRETRDPSCY